MHAVVIEVQIERPDEAAAYVQNTVVPRVRQAPGFVRGIWTHFKEGNTGRAILIFETEDQARTAGGVADRRILHRQARWAVRGDPGLSGDGGGYGGGLAGCP
jgi:hypothetical protein